MFRFNIPVTKVDEEKRLVYGLVTEEVVDQSGEILDYETSKGYFKSWSDSISKATGGSSLGNLRLMHQPVIAGKLVELNFDDVTKQISCVAKIVSDDVWKLVLEGCLTGFSMGGKYVKRWRDEATKGVHRFTAKPVEVSVVDNPCVSTATFEYIKSDGSTELRKFHTAGDGTQEDSSMFTPEQITARAAELAKAAGSPDATDQFMDEALISLEGEAEAQKAAARDEEPEEEGEDEKPEGEEEEEEEEEEEAEKAAAREEALADAAKSLVQVWQAPDGSTFSKKLDGAAHVLSAGEPESAVEKALRVARSGAEAPAEDSPIVVLHGQLQSALKMVEDAQTHIVPLAKGVYEVRELASIFTSLQNVTSMSAWEAKHEGDGSTVPASLMELLQGMGSALVAMAQEEVAEAVARTGKDMTELSSMPAVGSTVNLAAMGDMQKFAELVEKRTPQVEAEEPVDLEETDLVKSLRSDIEKRSTEIEKAVSGIAELGDLVKSQADTIAELSARVEKFGKSPQPLPPRSDHVIVERMGKTQSIEQADIEKMSADERADLAIRLAQTQPQHVGGN